jgi:PIN domain nuclease of toxin-antitoxin system
LRLLIDTHVFLWACDDPGRLCEFARRAIATSANTVLVSAASAWEIAIKAASGKLDFPVERWEEMTANLGFITLPITAAHALEAGSLPRHHTDPFDRMLVAQARLDAFALVTSDKKIAQYDVRIFGAVAS